MKVLPYFFTCLLLQTACCFGMQEPHQHRHQAPITLEAAVQCMKTQYHDIITLEQELAKQGRTGQTLYLKQLKAIVLHKHKEANDILHPAKKLRPTPEQTEALRLKFLAEFPMHDASMHEGYRAIERSVTPLPAPAVAECEAS